MKKITINIITLLTIFLFLLEGFVKGDDSEKEEWNLVIKKDGISIFYRWITIGDSLKAREIKADYIINADISSIVPLFQNPKDLKKWAVGIKECQIKMINESTWITYSLMNYPWPFKQKDLVTKQHLEQSDKMVTIHIRAFQGYIAEKSGIDRMKNYFGTWNFISLKNGRTAIDYRIAMYSKPLLPRIIQDPIVIKLNIKSLVDLKHLAEKQ